jgi:hypothetical protein
LSKELLALVRAGYINRTKCTKHSLGKEKEEEEEEEEEEEMHAEYQKVSFSGMPFCRRAPQLEGWYITTELCHGTYAAIMIVKTMTYHP